MAVIGRGDTPAADDPRYVLTPTECQAITNSAVVFRDEDFLQFREERLLAGSDDIQPQVDQLVVRFATPKAAVTAFESLAKVWGSCVNRAVVNTDTQDGSTETNLFRDFADSDGAVSFVRTVKEAPGFACQQYLTSKAEFVIDVSACGNQLANEAQTIGTKIAQRISS